jgi:hypothetical protein
VSNLSKAPFPLLESKHIKDTHGTQRGSFFYKERTSSDVKIKKKKQKTSLPAPLPHTQTKETLNTETGKNK